MRNLKSSGKGQAAMEFLMTYGWAIMVVLVVIGALGYFGVLNPSRFIPEKCDISIGFSCQDLVVSLGVDPDGAGALLPTPTQINIVNNLGRDLQITAISLLSDRTNAAGQRLYQCNSAALTISLVPGANINHVLDNTPNNPVTIPPTAGNCAAPSQVISGSKLKGTIRLSYLDLQTGITKTEIGQFVADVVA